MIADPHFQARDAIVEVETERFGALKMQGAFPRLSVTPSGVRSPAPSVVGQHNAEVYGAIGIDAQRLEALAAAGVI
jgi:formyl-CoA transferase